MAHRFHGRSSRDVPGETAAATSAAASTPLPVPAPDRSRTPGGTLRHIVLLAGQCLLLWLCYEAGVLIAGASHLPLPPNLLGLLLLLLLLERGVVPEAAVSEVGTFLSHHLNVFFVPFIVGVMACSSMLASSGAVLVLSLVGSAIVGILAAGGTAQWLVRRHR